MNELLIEKDFKALDLTLECLDEHVPPAVNMSISYPNQGVHLFNLVAMVLGKYNLYLEEQKQAQ